jgi:RNA polymerase sigma factor (sigma-70 family)
MAKSSHVSALSEIEILPPEFRAPFPDEDAASARLWHAWLKRRERGAFNTLFIRYLPMARTKAYWMKRNRPASYQEPLSDLISDGVLGVWKFIFYRKTYEPQLIRPYLSWTIARYIRRCVTSRFWAGASARRRLDELEHIRSSLTQDLGRVPSRSELTAELAKSITNPNIVIDVPKIQRSSGYPLAVEDDSDLHDGPMIDPDLLRRVAKGLDKRDRTILRMTLRGLCPAEIARTLGVSRECGRQLLNGLLWTLRASKQLAAAMGVEAIDRPRGSKSELPRIQTLGQARLAV